MIERLTLDEALQLNREQLEDQAKSLIDYLKSNVPCEATTTAAFQFKSCGIGYTFEILLGSVLLARRSLSQEALEKLQVIYACDRFCERLRYFNAEGELRSWERNAYEAALAKDNKSILSFFGVNN